MKIRHTVIFTFYDTTTEEQINDLTKRLDNMGEFLQKELRVTNWVVKRHVPETFKKGRASLLQDGVFPNLDSLKELGNTKQHKQVLELAEKVCDWMTVDTLP